MRWTTAAPAKVNLDLRMVGVRDDGYHLLTTVLQSIGLADQLTLLARPGPFAITCDTVGVPTDASNLAWKGATAMAVHLGVTLDGWQLDLDKQVPAQAGLGGGSADAAAAARLVAAAAGRVLAAAELADVIRPLGADVAFFAWGGTMLGEGVGDWLTPLPDVASAAVLLVRPPFGVSTGDAYRWYDDSARGARRGSGPGRGPDRAPQALRGVCLDQCTNDLEGPVVARHPEIGRVVARLRDSGARLAAMSGSGSACVGLFDPGADLSRVVDQWPEGTQVWHTVLLDRPAYAERTACVPRR